MNPFITLTTTDGHPVRINVNHIVAYDLRAFKKQYVQQVAETFTYILIAGGERSRADQLIISLGLEARASHIPEELSAGEQQRVGLARALVHRPKLVLADEPTGNLDDVSAEAVVLGLRDFVENGGSVLVVTHDPRVLEKADRVITLEGGRISS